MPEDGFEARPTCQRPASGTTGVCPEGPAVTGEKRGGDLVQAPPLPRPMASEKSLTSGLHFLHL